MKTIIYCVLLVIFTTSCTKKMTCDNQEGITLIKDNVKSDIIEAWGLKLASDDYQDYKYGFFNSMISNYKSYLLEKLSEIKDHKGDYYEQAYNQYMDKEVILENIIPEKYDENEISIQENCVIMASSTGSQVSSWFNEKKQGLFTYYFLRAFQDREKSDVNKDNKLTYKEIADYISDKTNGVPYMARKLHNVEQNPTIQGTGVDNVFIEFK